MLGSETPLQEPENDDLWWSRPGGFREVLTLSGPLVASSLSWTVMNFVDRVFLMSYSEDTVAAALPAGVVFFTLTCLPLGVAMYVTTFVSQYHGAGRPERIGPAVWQGLILTAIGTPVIWLAIPWAETWFRLAKHAPEIAALETVYFQICCVGAPAIIAAGALSGFFTGRGHARVVMVVDVLAAVVNVVLDWLWIFGLYGFPEAGIAGAAWATVVALWFKAVVYFAMFLYAGRDGTFGARCGFGWDTDLMRRLLRYGGPNGMQMVIEVGAFTIFLLLLGQLGKHELAASSLAFNMNNLAFMPAWGVGMATSTLVGQYLGRERPDLAARSTWTALAVTTIYMAIISAVYIGLPDLILAAHWTAGEIEQDDVLRQTLPTLLWFVASYSLFDGMNVIFAGAIKGAGDTRFIMFTNLVLGTSIVCATWYAITQAGVGLYGAWTILTLWVCSLGVIFGARFLQGRWRTMRVIEEQVPIE